ncbi:MAG TPA: PAS domain-containing protein [Phycisphaerales bacterium]|nr:PAS domain-containing protein [Phycisphaerales bacterium]
MSEPQKLPFQKVNKADDSQKAHVVNSCTNWDLNFGLLGKSIFQSLPVGVIVFDPDLKIIKANPQAAKLVELDDYIDKSLAKTKSVGRSGAPEPDWTQQLRSVISTGKTRSFGGINYTFSKNGETKWLRVVCTPYQPTKTAGNLGGIILIEDITEKVDTQRQLANAEKLATVGKLTFKVAHELNNPMDGILRYINLTIRIIEQENLEKPKEYLVQCRQGLMRMVQIVSELLEFSRSTYHPFEYVNIEQIIEDVIKTMETKAEASNIRVLRNYRPGIPQIRNGDLFQVFCNLIKNAMDAMPDGGELNISTRLAADNSVVAEFHDTGAGLPSENTEVIFEPFFTTKDKGKGTGLGLAICRDIVERYHGRITAENALQGGSIFTVYLPAANENP